MMKTNFKKFGILASLFIMGFEVSHGQQLQITDFIMYAGNGGPGCTVPLAPGYAVQFG